MRRGQTGYSACRYGDIEGLGMSCYRTLAVTGIKDIDGHRVGLVRMEYIDGFVAGMIDGLYLAYSNLTGKLKSAVSIDTVSTSVPFPREEPLQEYKAKAINA